MAAVKSRDGWSHAVILAGRVGMETSGHIGKIMLRL
jgi:hypothetical protein